MREPVLFDYLDARCAPVPDYLLQVERSTHLHVLKAQMLCGHMQGRFLCWLISWLRPLVAQRPFRVLEIGTFTGYSALCFAERLRSGDEVHTIEINDELQSIIEQHFALSGFAERLALHIGDANTLIASLPGPWDLVYLDAKKDDYPQQFEQISKKLAPGAHVLLDNVLWDGQVLDTSENRATTVLLREFTLSLAQNPYWEVLTLPMHDGLMLVRAATLS